MKPLMLSMISPTPVPSAGPSPSIPLILTCHPLVPRWISYKALLRSSLSIRNVILFSTILLSDVLDFKIPLPRLHRVQEAGVPHCVQTYLFPDKLFNCEVSRGNAATNITYVEKLYTHILGPFSHGAPSISGVKREYTEFAKLAMTATSADVFKKDYPVEYLRHKRAADELIQENLKKTLTDRITVYPFALLRWHVHVIDNIVKQPPEMRYIHWIWSKLGDMYKSTLGLYLAKNHGAYLITDTTQTSRVLFQYDNQPLVVIDIDRQDGEETKVNYKVLERLKSGSAFLSMYNPRQVFFAPPTVIVFANILPDGDKCSIDRFKILCVDPPPPKVTTPFPPVYNPFAPK